MLRVPKSQENRNVQVVKLSAVRNGCLHPFTRYPWGSSLLDTESNPGPQCNRKSKSEIEQGTFRIVPQFSTNCDIAVQM